MTVRKRIGQFSGKIQFVPRWLRQQAPELGDDRVAWATRGTWMNCS
jgi:hypothetical protein